MNIGRLVVTWGPPSGWGLKRAPGKWWALFLSRVMVMWLRPKKERVKQEMPEVSG